MREQREQRAAEERGIAIVGVSCRFPGGVNSLPELWEALEGERDLITRVPPDRFDADRFVDTATPRPGMSYTAAGGFLDDFAGFDAAYFGISPAEAPYIDPQHRLLLELTAEALDDAAVAPELLAGTDTAVYIGISDSSYLAVQDQREFGPHTMTGVASSIAANRISHAFDLRGPSMVIDTACSSSLVALDRACRTLAEGTSRTALCGGANLLLSPWNYVGFAQASMLSARGRCAAFSAHADGFVRAEGGAVLLLKPLADALAAGDRIHGVILGTGTNCDGRTPGLALPSAEAQEDLLGRVHAEAGVRPDELSYFEAHGTGTPVGDPVEATAIGRALGMRRITGELPIGSVKTNLGHLEPASGMAGLCKALLVLRHRTVPVSLHAQPLNPGIDFAALGLRPATEKLALPPGERPVAAVNSFGFGGANAHVVVAADRPRHTPPPARRPRAELPVIVTARSGTALKQAAQALARHLEGIAPHEFPHAVGTAWRRGRHEHRAVVLAGTALDAARRLSELAADPPPGTQHDSTGSAERPAPAGAPGAVARAVGRGRTAFVYSGNGSQWEGMGAGLYTHDPVFRAAVDELDACLLPHLGWSVATALTAPPDTWRLNATERAQPLLFAVQTGITAVLRERGITPSAVLGHSVGEVAAAHTAGALDTAAAARVIAARSAAQAPFAGSGRMAAVGLGADDAADAVAAYAGELEIAGVNSPRDVTIAGPADSVRAFGEEMSRKGIFFRELDLDYAFHSAAMAGCEHPLAHALQGLSADNATIPFYSTVTGTQLRGDELDAAYWWYNVRRPVRFADAVTLAREDGADVFLEIGPHPVLGTYLRRCLSDGGREHVAVLPTLRRHQDGPHTLATAVATLLATGAAADTSRLLPSGTRVTDLPAYPWQRQHHWIGTPQSWQRTSGNGLLEHPLLGERMPAPHPTWHGSLEPTVARWLPDHRIRGSVVMPATGYVDMVLAAGRAALGGTCLEADHVLITSGLAIPWPDASAVQLQLALRPEDGTVTITSTHLHNPTPRPHVTARVRTLTAPRPAPVDLAGIRDRCPRLVDAADYYRAGPARGLDYGPAFQVLAGLRQGTGEILATYHHEAPGTPYVVHPAVLDGALQAGTQLLAERLEAGQAYLPSSIASVRVWRTPAPTGSVWVRERSRTEDEVRWDLTLTDEDGNVSVRVEGCRLRRPTMALGTPVTLHETVLRAVPLAGDPCTSPLPPLTAPRELVAAAGPRITAARGKAGEPPGRADALAALKEFAARHHTRALAALLQAPDAPFAPDDLPGDDEMPAGHRAWRLQMLDLMRRHRTVTALGDGRWQLTSPGDPTEAARRCLAADPSLGAALALAASADRHWSGTRDPAPATAPTPVADSLPGLGAGYRTARLLLSELVRRWPADRPLRVLEAGAPTGALTAALLPVLPPERTRYRVTGVPPSALPAVQARFTAYDFVSFHAAAAEGDGNAGVDAGVDAGGDAADREAAGERFDLVVADGPDMLPAPAAVLRRAATLLAPGGLLLTVVSHDRDLRASLHGPAEHADASPDAPPDDTGTPDGSPPDRAWAALLRQCGFTEVTRAQDGEPEAHGGHSVLLAATDATDVGDTATPLPSPAVPVAPGFLVLTDDDPAEGPLVRRLAAALAERGCAPVRTGRICGTADDWRALLDAARPSGPDGDTTALHVVLVPGRTRGAGPRAGTERAARGIAALGALAAAQEHRSTGPEVLLRLVTHPHDAVPLAGTPATTDPAAAALWGAARTLANEHPQMRCRRTVHVRTGDAAADARRLAAELLPPGGEDDEDEVVLTPSGRFAPRERPYTPGRRLPVGTTPFGLQVRDTGLSYRLSWTEIEPPRPGPGEVALEVRAVGLNYRDIMQSSGLLPTEFIEGTFSERGPGIECSGVVTACGPGVTAFRPGDRVMGTGPAALATHCVLKADFVQSLPDRTTFGGGAASVIASLTVSYGLGRLAGLRAGETVLVHGAAGAVGLAALRYTEIKAARLIATAGSERKRSFLRALGVEHVLDSRSLDFADQVRDLTGGRGVDVVLNSLAGEAMHRSMELLRPGGRFIELGKRDIYENKPLPLRLFRNNVAFFTMDVSELVNDLGTYRQVVEDLSAEYASEFPGLPHTPFPAARVEEAFRLLQHSRHIGKVVITFDPLDEPPLVEPAPCPPAPDPRGTYLVTGGTGGFGAATARWLADRGARHIALVSRRGPEAPEAAAVLADLAGRGAEATAHAADVTDLKAMRRLVRAIDRTGFPLRGVVHAAMCLDDAQLTELDEDRIAAVLAPKTTGAAVLDILTRDRDCDLFLLHSSATTTLGNLAQAPYVAGNLVLEALARERRRRNRAGQAVAWGAIADTGYVARNDLTGNLASLGIETLTPREAFAAAGGLPGTPDAVGIGRYRWPRVAALLPAATAPRLRGLVPADAGDDVRTREDFLGELSRLPADAALQRLVTELTALIAGTLHISPDDLDPHTRLDAYGMDSLLGTQLLAALQQRFDVRIPPMELLGSGATITGFAQQVHQRLGLGQDATPTTETLLPADEQGPPQAQTTQPNGP
ncbi:SDR family NAD(P)-dependent oxidoreductase [Streptomyces sp. NPDC008001]|uniref:SDR family NAD(P)-dependent oxidoreductase n=1 Tax=Streptomyces sp. NPDC008001 TaxID=3364804 RepID=UPI0036ED9345